MHKLLGIDNEPYFCYLMLKINNALLQLSDRFAIGPVSINIDRGNHVAIIGESGCGKTTLLKMIYGLFDLDAGSLVWEDRGVTGPKDNLIPGMPFIKYLSQDFDLMPFTSVAENINKYLSRLEPKTSKIRTEELMEVVEMTAYGNVKVKTLSGGQKQRVALAQTLAKEPELLLLDEPFSHIDNFRKNKLRRRLFTYLKQQNITCLVATHDSTDVLSYMDQTIIMKDGKVLAHDSTTYIYNNPSSYYVGSLFGDINRIPKKWFFKDVQTTKEILLYPHQLKVASKGKSVTVTQSYFMGSHYLIKAICDNNIIFFNHHNLLEYSSKHNIIII